MPHPPFNLLDDIDLSKAILKRTKTLALNSDSAQFNFSESLDLVQKFNLWELQFKSFEEYVTSELGISKRTAQEQLKVFRACKMYGIPKKTAAELGWSKLALVTKHFDGANTDDIITDVKNLSYAALKQKYSLQKRDSSSDKSNYSQRIQMTEDIKIAVDVAMTYTNSTDIQINLEFIAQSFRRQQQISSRLFSSTN